MSPRLRLTLALLAAALPFTILIVVAIPALSTIVGMTTSIAVVIALGRCTEPTRRRRAR
jgi:hypothetical protein